MVDLADLAAPRSAWGTPHMATDGPMHRTSCLTWWLGNRCGWFYVNRTWKQTQQDGTSRSTATCCHFVLRLRTCRFLLSMQSWEVRRDIRRHLVGRSNRYAVFLKPRNLDLERRSLVEMPRAWHLIVSPQRVCGELLWYRNRQEGPEIWAFSLDHS